LHYDPIKNTFARLVKRTPFLRKIFYKALGLMFLREWYVKKWIQRLKDSPASGGQKLESILDAGSGFGQYSYFMAKKFKDSKVLSIDVKEDQIEDCRYFFERVGLKNCEFRVVDLTKMEYEDRFDFILSVDVMEHIEDDEEALRRFYRALKRNGIVMINTPSNLGGSDVNEHKDESFIGEHVRTGYSKEEICGKLEKSGFTIESFEYTYGKWGKRYWKLGIKIPMLMLNKSQFFFIILPFYYLATIWFVLLFMFLDVNEKNKKEGTGILVMGRKS
jgi:2-polyprenyl-3-methyl-5-hydroxy-6-metoxy-1,4-benzoquinol methylase